MLLWLACVTRKEPPEAAEFVYSLLGEEKAYALCHTLRNTGILPEETEP